MHTDLAAPYAGTDEGEEARAILRNCVHCGFCTATCPTYQLLGDELDGPRGRIYLIKQTLEGQAPGADTQLHLDRCLACRSCETTCPSGVQYGRLLEIGRKAVDAEVARPPLQRLQRAALREVLPRRWLFTPLLRAGQALRPLLPSALRTKVPARVGAAAASDWPARSHARAMLLPSGCVQDALAPDIDAAAARVLDALGVQLWRARRDGCCGALRLHLGDERAAQADARRNIDAWWPAIEAGAEAIVLTASGCGAMVREYGHLLRADPAYAGRAARVTALARDLSEIVYDLREALAAAVAASTRPASPQRVAYHPPCSLQHGQQVRGKVEAVLALASIDVVLPADSHLCCGSAGTYSITQPALSQQLRDDKLARLRDTGASCVVSANIGCQLHLTGGGMTMEHWICALDRTINDRHAENRL